MRLRHRLRRHRARSSIVGEADPWLPDEERARCDVQRRQQRRVRRQVRHHADRRRLAALLDLLRRQRLRLRHATSPSTRRATSTSSARRARTNFPLVNPIATEFIPLEPFVVKLNARGHDAPLLDLLRRRGRTARVLTAVATNAAGDTYIAGGTNDSRDQPADRDRLPDRQSVPGDLRRRRRRRASSRGSANGVDLKLTKTAAPEPVATGGDAHLHAHDHQQPHRSGAIVTLTDPLPAGVTFASCAARPAASAAARATAARSRSRRSPAARRRRSPSRPR